MELSQSVGLLLENCESLASANYGCSLERALRSRRKESYAFSATATFDEPTEPSLCTECKELKFASTYFRRKSVLLHFPYTRQNRCVLRCPERSFGVLWRALFSLFLGLLGLPVLLCSRCVLLRSALFGAFASFRSRAASRDKPSSSYVSASAAHAR